MEDSTHIVLDSELGIADAERIYKILQGSYNDTKTITIDSTHTERIDTSISQLLYAYMRTSKSNNIRINWKPSAAVTAAMERLGLDVQSTFNTEAQNASFS
ncbi:MAG: hypothetical protein COC05_05545 [Gammaproteobacteria bacterium]|nr:MAG: hypothetical protein COC05_05545 [Gammaproteobacteria bacterium]